MDAFRRFSVLSRLSAVYLLACSVSFASGQEITKLTVWTRAKDAFSENDSVVASAPLVGLNQTKITVRMTCVRNQGAPKWPSVLHFHYGVSGSAFDIVSASVMHEGGTIGSPTLAYSTERTLHYKEKLDSGNAVETNFSISDPHNLDFDSRIDWYINPDTKEFPARSDLIGFSVNGVDVAIQWLFSQASMSGFLRDCSTPLGPQIPLWKVLEENKLSKDRETSRKQELANRPEIKQLQMEFRSNPFSFVTSRIGTTPLNTQWGAKNPDASQLRYYFIRTTRPVQVYADPMNAKNAYTVGPGTICSIYGGSSDQQPESFNFLSYIFWHPEQEVFVSVHITCADPERAKYYGIRSGYFGLGEPIGEWIENPLEVLKSDELFVAHPRYANLMFQ